MLYHVEDPKFWVNQGYRYASATYGAMDRSYKRVREESPPEHSTWGAIENTAGGAFAGYQLGHLLGESGLELPPLLGGATQTPGAALAPETPPLIGQHWGLSPGGWGAILGAGIGLLSYLFS